MRKGFKRALALVGALVLTFSMSASIFAADKPEIVLNGGEEGASKMIGKYSGPESRGNVTDDYKYLGFASYLDLADGDYKYLEITYTGNITQFRIQAVHDAGKDSEEIDTVKYWFNAEVVEDSSNKPLVTADGSAIPLEGKNTTVVIDLAKSGIDTSYYNSGLHMHCDMMKTYGDFEIVNAKLIADEKAVDTPSKNDDGDSKPENGNDSNTDGNTNNNTTANKTGAPATGASRTPIVLGFAGIALACVAFATSRKFKEEN